MPRSKKTKRRGKTGGTQSAPLSPHARGEAISKSREAMNAGDVGLAERQSKRVLRADPNDAEALEVLAGVHFRRGDAMAAAEVLKRAVGAQPTHAGFRANLGMALLYAGDPDGAAASLREAIAIDPAYPNGEFELANALSAAGRHAEAAEILGSFLARHPDDAPTLNNLGLELFESGDTEHAIARYRDAIALDPGNPHIRYNLFEALERRNRIDELRDALIDADRNIGAHPQFALARANLFKRDDDIEAALAALVNVDPEEHAGDVGDPRFWRRRAHLMGDLYDRLGDAERAFDCFAESNRLALRDECPPGVDKAGYLRRIADNRAYFTRETVNGWPAVFADDGRVDPVFLVGFPRSGTTLLDMVLRGHADIAALEEVPMIANAVAALRALPGGDPAALTNLDIDGLAAIRGAYFAEMDRTLGDADRDRPVIVDKLPLNLVEAGFIHRVFPRAKFILALRHPCDCVLSCFMHTFKLNSAMANFLDLGDAARLYDEAFSLWRQYRDVLALPVHELRYEDMIVDLEGTIRPLLEFLELPWDPGVLAYAETAKRTRIDTPSYGQVVQPLYTRARGRWEKYGEHLSPHLSRLAPWIEKFGYGGNDEVG